MDARQYAAWLETPGGRVYAATHGGRASALAQQQNEGFAEMKRLRDVARDHEMEYPEPEPGYLADSAADAGQTLALYESAMDKRRRAHTEQLRYGPLVRLETGPSMAGATADIAARLRRENPLWGVEAGAEQHERTVRLGTDATVMGDPMAEHWIAWENVNA